MRSSAWVLAIVVTTAWGVGCGSPSSSDRPDTGRDVPADTVNPPSRDADLDAAKDVATLPEAAAESAPDREGGIVATDAVPPADLAPDSTLPLPDAPIIDAPVTNPDAPLPDADDTGDADAFADVRDGDSRDTRDAFVRDTPPAERPRRDASPDRLADANSDTPANLVVPEVTGTIYSFRFGDTVFAVDAAKGARIVTFSLGGRNVLTAARNAGDINWGSTFWPSPQSDWSWPPPTEIDSGAYTASLAGATLTLTGATASSLGLSVTKEFTVDGVAGVVSIEYRIINRGTRSRSVAPWEISRVAAGGLTFFPMGEGAPSKGSQPLLPLDISGGVAWLAYDPSVVTGEAKVFADGSEGWIAHATGSLLLVKAFGDTTPAQAAPSETEIELYADPTHSYIEVENQGALTSLAAGASLTWTVRWFLRELDTSVVLEPGSADLLGTVRALVESP
jgi:hypothetical protein